MRKLLFILLLFLLAVTHNILGQAVATVHRSVPIDSAARIKNIRHTIEFCTRAINSRGQNKGTLINSYVVRAMNYASIKEYKKAISDYTFIVSLNPKFADAYLYRAASYDAIQNYQSAIKDYERCLTFVTNDLRATAFLYNTIAIDQKKLKQYDKAIESCSQAISLAPNFGMIYANRGELYGVIGKYQLAIDDFNTAMEGYRDNKILLSTLVSERADMERYLKQYKNAVNDFSYAIQLNPDNKIAYWNMAASYNNNGDYQLADEAYSKAILYYKGDNKNLSKLYDDRALMEIGQQQYKKALEDDSLSISLDNQFAPAYWNKAIAYAQNADFQLSIDAYTKTMDFYKYNKRALAQLYDNIASEAYFLNDYKKVIDASTSAISLDERSWSPYLNRGRAYLKKMNKDLATADFKKVLELDTTKKSFEYAFALFYTGEPDKAIDIMQNSLIATTNNYALMSDYYNMACLYSLMNKPGEANAFLKKCVDGGYPKKYAQNDPDLDNIRNTTEFKSMIGENILR